MRNLSLDRFSEELFSKNAIPGGGGATALVGALAVSLGAMAANLTVGKVKYAEHTARLEEILIRAEELRVHLLELIDEDAKGFGEVSKAYKLKPKDEEVIEKALVSAATPPLNMMKAVKEVIELLDELSAKTSVLVVSDVGVGAKLAGAALSSAYLNIVVNTRLMKNKAEAESLEKKAENLYFYGKKADEIYDKIVNIIR
ncbi:MAG: cyclodeaminase/cyclohydrolase family protein [Catonella sp.]|uniref:cyclodeaminase/cyclohydrolase family protein n=1 Tax=Catonella sp. TaxID=2382125 RepID=UPI003FA186D0